jgi:hypothetical protein
MDNLLLANTSVWNVCEKDTNESVIKEESARLDCNLRTRRWRVVGLLTLPENMLGGQQPQNSPQISRLNPGFGRELWERRKSRLTSVLDVISDLGLKDYPETG